MNFYLCNLNVLNSYQNRVLQNLYILHIDEEFLLKSTKTIYRIVEKIH